MSKRLIIEQIARTKSDGSIETLEFTDGVNAIVAVALRYLGALAV